LKDKKIIGYLGAMMPWHGISDLLKAFEILVNDYPEQRNKMSPSSIKADYLVLLIIGGNKDELTQIGGEPVRELILQNRIVPVGRVDYDLVPYYLNICDVLAAPFNTRLDVDRRELYERFGMWWCPIKLFEYLATGKPIVTTDLKEIRSYLSSNAYYHTEGDPFDLVKAITSALKEGEDPELQARRKTHFKNNFTWEIQAKKIIGLTEKSKS
jgi:glycosyltransferase involved in cell wall biosynthesis